MVVGAFPIAKLGLLGIKHIAKPITNLIKRAAVKNPAFKTVVVAPTATLYHNISVRSKMWMLGMRQPRFVPPLNNAMSTEMGANLLGEMCIFLIGALALTAEFSRHSRNEKSKQEENKLVRQQLETKITDLTEKVSLQTKEIRQLKMLVGSMERSNDCLETMVIGSFPLGKIFLYGVKRVSKPVGNLLMWAGKHNTHVRRYVITPPAQLYNMFEVRWKMRMLGFKQPRRVPPLPPAMATQLGSDLLSEVIVLIIGVGIILHEFSRQQLKTPKKQKEQMEQRRVMFEQLDGISAEIEQQDKDISFIKAALDGYQRK